MLRLIKKWLDIFKKKGDKSDVLILKERVAHLKI